MLEPDTKVEIDSRLSDIIRIGMDYYEKTNHLFNIASGNLTEVWKEFINNCDKLPTDTSLNQNINMEDITLDKNTYIKHSNIKLDLGAITKGYATEKVGAYLESIGIKSYVINAGGNVKVGIPYNKENYVIGVTNPDDTENIFTKVKVKSLSVVTSGNYQRYCILDNVNYSHIINPITKYPVFDKKSVTVISKDSTLADIYSTYLYILPIEEGLSLVNNNPSVEAIWYIDKDNIVRSDGFNYE